MNDPFIGSPDHVEAMLHWSFSDRPDVQELLTQLNGGLISPVDYSRAILRLWAEHSGESS